MRKGQKTPIEVIRKIVEKRKANGTYVAWNKGRKYTPKEKSRLNLKGLALGHGWNKDTKGVMMPNQTSFKKGVRISVKTEFKKGEMSSRQMGEKNSNWRGGKYATYERSKPNAIAKAKRRIEREKSASGKHTESQWENLKKLYNFMCLCCKRFEPEVYLTKDHIVPLYYGGSNDISNLQPLCRSCNSKKGLKRVTFIERNVNV